MMAATIVASGPNHTENRNQLRPDPSNGDIDKEAGQQGTEKRQNDRDESEIIGLRDIPADENNCQARISHCDRRQTTLGNPSAKEERAENHHKGGIGKEQQSFQLGCDMLEALKIQKSADIIGQHPS